jgi:hypothetical protein
MRKKSFYFIAGLLVVLILAGCSGQVPSSITIPAASAPAADSPAESARTGSPEATVVITRDFGREMITNQRISISEPLDAMKALQSAAKVETAYGGSFVKSINGQISNLKNKLDWFFYINGISANTGAGDYLLQPGDVEIWDFHNWGFQQSILAVTGFFPFTFNQGYAGNIRPTIIAYGDNCQSDAENLHQEMEKQGTAQTNCRAISALSSTDKEVANLILIGTPESPLIKDLNSKWKRLGLFAYFQDGKLVVLDADGEIADRYGAGSGIVLATQNPWNPKGTGAAENVVWMISGTDTAGVSAAVDVLINHATEMRSSFGIIISDSKIIKIP